MNKNFQLKLGLIVATLLIFAYGIFGIPENFSGNGLLAAMRKRINLGLDLRGGIHLILQVQVNDAVNADSDRAIERLKDSLKVTYTDMSKPEPDKAPDRIVIKGVPLDSGSVLRAAVETKLPEYDLTSGAEGTWVLAMKPNVLRDLKQHAVTQAIETIRGRVDTLGVSEPVIEEHHGLNSEYQILVQLPGIDDPERVKDIIKSSAMLEIKQVLGGSYLSEEAALQANNGIVPPGGMLLHGRPESGQPGDVVWLVSRSSAVSGNDLRDAQPGQDQTGQPNVTFFLTVDGGKRFKAFTGSHIDDRLGVVLDNQVVEVANIKSAISDQGEISGGGMTEEKTKDLSMVLRSGALPAGIHFLEERTVGPSLGADSIRAGVRAAIFGMLAVMIFMLIYYRGAGINADLALILNLLILLGFLGFSSATLTLPGIAGVILTIGMGVDSNVLIFERIREELRGGRTAAAAVEQGFGRAWVTIVDTHVTTVVSAAILFIFGSGPVRGFAITLIFGLLANLFTAVFVSRVIFDWILTKKGRGEALSI